MRAKYEIKKQIDEIVKANKLSQIKDASQMPNIQSFVADDTTTIRITKQIPEEALTNPQAIRYYYDPVHNVSIWVYETNVGGSIGVLPSGQVTNPGLPMK